MDCQNSETPLGDFSTFPPPLTPRRLFGPQLPGSATPQVLQTAQDHAMAGGDTYTTSDMRYNIVGGLNNVNNMYLNNFGYDHQRSDGFEMLFKNIAQNAMHNSGEVSAQPKCHPRTREAIIEALIEWASSCKPQCQVEWVYGPAGTGKSTILRTIAQLLADKGLLLGSFFFFRTSEMRNTAKHFIPTLAYQLARQIPTVKEHISKEVEVDPAIFSLSLWDQAKALIVSPLRSALRDPSFDFNQHPSVLVIDGLDECGDKSSQRQILSVLFRIIQNVHSAVLVLIASRPEHHIREAFNSGDLNHISTRISLDSSYNPDKDIRKFLVDKFEDFRNRDDVPRSCKDTVWPEVEIVEKLVAKASGQFMYASTVISYVCSPRHNPMDRLGIVMGAIKSGSQKPFEQLDSLYEAIFNGVDEDSLDGALRVLGFVLIPSLDLPKRRSEFPDSRLSPNYIEHFLELQEGDVRRYLYDLEALLAIGRDDEDIKFSHASLSDYLFDSSRSGRFWIDCDGVYNDILKICLSRMHSWHELLLVIVNHSDTFSLAVKPNDDRLQSLIEELDPNSIFRLRVVGVLTMILPMPQRRPLSRWFTLGSVEENHFLTLCICPAILRLAEMALPHKEFRKKLDQFRPIMEHPLYRLLIVVSREREMTCHLWKFFERENLKNQAPLQWYLKYLAENPNHTHFSYDAECADMASHLLKMSLRLFRKSTLTINCLHFLISRSNFNPELLQQCQSLYSEYKDAMASRNVGRFFSNLGPALEAYISRANTELLESSKVEPVAATLVESMTMEVAPVEVVEAASQVQAVSRRSKWKFWRNWTKSG